MKQHKERGDGRLPGERSPQFAQRSYGVNRDLSDFDIGVDALLQSSDDGEHSA